MGTPLPLHLVALLAAAGPHPEVRKPPPIFIAPVKLDETARGKLNAGLEELLLAVVESTGDYFVLEPRDFEAILPEERQNELAACDEPTCLAELGAALGVRLVLASRIALLDDTWLFAADLIDVQAGAVIDRISDLTPGGVRDLADAVPGTVGKLLDGGQSRDLAADGSAYACRFGDLDGCTAQCTAGGGRSCAVLAYMYGLGRGVPVDAVRAWQLFHKACTHGEQHGCVKLGYVYHETRALTEGSDRTALLYRRSCETGEAKGCAFLGFMYEHGKGVRQNDNEAVQLYQKACDAGELYGCAFLGYMYDHGKVGGSAARALQLYEAACSAGEAAGCGLLAQMYSQGNGVAKDDNKAVRFYQKACEGGEARGCAVLGHMYETGTGIKQDRARAARLYEKACEAGGGYGCDNLARLRSKVWMPALVP